MPVATTIHAVNQRTFRQLGSFPAPAAGLGSPSEEVMTYHTNRRHPSPPKPKPADW